METTEKSSLITTTSSSEIEKYRIPKIGSKVNENEIVVNKKANDKYKNIMNLYTKINNDFQEIAKEYRLCASKSVKGDKICASLKKVATNCENQGKACLEKKKILKSLFTYSSTERATKALNDATSSGSRTSNSSNSSNNYSGRSNTSNTSTPTQTNSGNNTPRKDIPLHTTDTNDRRNPNSEVFRSQQRQGRAIRQWEYQQELQRYQQQPQQQQTRNTIIKPGTGSVPKNARIV